ncbi:hypothetical protein LIX17_25365 (plasmid) [Mycobacterium avium subsp. hominissuis]|uniref:hypothetical protein n=1 Tax=Mycobacterium avium TaxID=1764 RepID=UPI0031409C70
MRALRITASGWWQTVDIDPTTSRPQTAAVALRHNIELWYRTAADPDAEPNMAAMTLLPSVSDLGPHTVPMIYGDAIVVGVDPASGTPAPMTERQYHAISYALLSSLSA